jgi:hypothetical protein
MAAPWTEHGEQQQPCEEETKYPAGVKPVIHLQNRRGNGDRPAALHERGVNALLFRAFKWSVYGLLALNLGLFLLFETPVEALDSLGWLVLLGVLERETSTLGRPRSARETAALWAAQGAGYAVVVLAWAGYAHEGMWLDFANASLWLGVALALAFDVRFPPDDAAQLRAHRSRQAVRGALYAGLVALALWWAATGELLNGFDAALWLLCFFAVEGNILRYESAEPAPQPRPDF